MIVPDINLLLYATSAESPQHPQAWRWLESLLNGDEPVGLPRMTINGFIRVSTNTRVFTAPWSIQQAVATVDSWLSRRVVLTIEPGDAHWSIFRTLLVDAGRGGNLTTDAHLAALCIERGATLHSADGDFARFRGLRYVNPLLHA